MDWDRFDTRVSRQEGRKSCRPILFSFDLAMTPRFRKFWVDATGQKLDEVPELVAKTLGFVVRGGGPPSRLFRVPKVLLRAKKNNRGFFWGSYHQGTIELCVSTNPAKYQEWRHYWKKPIMPYYLVQNVREAIVAGVAHEASHWLQFGRGLPADYWKVNQAKNGTEYICEVMSVAALAHLCPNRLKERFKKI